VFFSSSTGREELRRNKKDTKGGTRKARRSDMGLCGEGVMVSTGELERGQWKRSSEGGTIGDEKELIRTNGRKETPIQSLANSPPSQGNPKHPGEEA